MSKCYILMPYIGVSEEDSTRFEEAYKSIMVAAARKAGFEDEDIIRQEYDGEPAEIMKKAISNLVECDVVIADISTKDVNIIYEIGLSNVFRKSGTVLVACEGSDVLPEFVGADVIEYSMEKESVCAERLAETIRQRMKGKAADNGVHATLTDLPDSLGELLELDAEELGEQIKKLSEENEELKAKVEALDAKEGLIVSTQAEGTRSIRDILNSTKQRLQYSGAAAIQKLSELAESEEWEVFLDHLVDVMEIGAPSAADLNTIAQIAEQSGNRVLVQDVLEASLTLCPEDPTLISRLAKLYADQPANRDRARGMIESAIGMTRDEDGKITAVNRGKINHNSVARLFDSYSYMGAYADLVEAGEFILENGGQKERDMIYRNILRANINAGELEKAKEYISFVEANDTAVDYWIISLYYDEAGDPVKAYNYLEKAMIADPEDPDYPRMMASAILNEGIARVSDESVEPVAPKVAQESAAAFLYYLIQRNREDGQVIANLQTFAQMGGLLEDYFADAIPYLKGEEEELPYENTNLDGLNYCLARVGEE